MPKRLNPFSNESPFQLKMHIGLKEVNLGVNKLQNMRTVHYKTQQLLFMGSQTLHSIPTPCKQNNHVRRSTVNGSIEPTGNDRRESEKLYQQKDSSNQNCVQDFKKCCQLNLNNTVCSFCDRRICSECQRICAMCGGEFCHLCSLLQYHTQEEIAVCLSCL